MDANIPVRSIYAVLPDTRDDTQGGASGAAAKDEMVDGHGGLRPHWRAILATFQGFGEHGLSERAARLDRAFAEEGVTALLPGASPDAPAWRCDPVPLPIPAGEFVDLEAALVQRARLLSALLDDVYGPQALLREGVLPPAAVYGNRNFLRALHQPDAGPQAVSQRLQFYAADLLRGPDGAWRVLSDRTSAASGIGYARENRRLLTRVLPEGFKLVQVRSMRPFFDRWQDALHRMAPDGRANPVVALLTAGITDPQWFEHLFLSRELSCALVESGDLTVRGGVVFLKTLRGLQRVDVILRRIDGQQLDPLELDGRHLAGVPGLLDAMRAGNVRIVNDSGAGFAEAPMLAAFLPALASRLLGEQLLLDSVPTLWLGEPHALARVRQNLPGWLLRDSFDSRHAPVAPSELPPEARGALFERIGRRPQDWTAVAVVNPSTAPCLTAEGLQPRPVIVRLFLAFDGERWQAMPGGLARVVPVGVHPGGALPQGGLSKDLWVLTEDRADIVGPGPLAVAPLALRRSSGELPSRVADNLFWLGRYVERLERAARLVRAAVARLVRAPTALPRELAELHALANCLCDAGMIDAEQAKPSLLPEALLSMLARTREAGERRPRGSIVRIFGEIARLTESVRDRLTGDMYATFTQTLAAARVETEQSGRSLDGLGHAMVAIQRFCTAVAGAAAENMVRGGGFLFLDLGRRIERAQAVAGEVGRALDQPAGHIEIGLSLILELCDSAITYRSRYMNALQAAPVLDLVLADLGNPRGLAFQLAAMHGLLDELTPNGVGGDHLAGAAAGLLAQAEALVSDVLAAPNQAATAATMPRRLHEIAAGVASLSDRISRRYFALLPAAQTLGWGEDAAAMSRDAK